MLNSDASALPSVRRIITGHNEAGVAVVRSEDTVAAEVRRSCMLFVALAYAYSCMQKSSVPGLSGHQLWLTNETPTNDNNSECVHDSRPKDDLRK